ncbi:MAG TPA: hypothetical protein VMJ31_09320 [Methylocystis sp.]|nr:hypothetical protein [Methylocystis sp.]
MRRVFAAMTIVLATSASATTQVAAYKTQISTTIRLFDFDNGKYTAEIRTQAMPCPGVSVDNFKTYKGVVDEEDVMNKLKDYMSALYASIDHQTEKCYKR